MQIGVIGLNHKSAELELRERLATIALRRFGDFSFHGTLPYILLTTCNRTEIYFSSDDLAEAHTYILSILREDICEEFEHTIYSYFGSDCFFHLAKVTVGMDSAIVGETEIQGQVKAAYEKAALKRELSRELHYLFQKSLMIGKHIRTKKPPQTLEERLLERAISLLGSVQEKKILIVGISDINIKILKSLILKDLKNITLCNRTFEKANRIATQHNLATLPWESLKEIEEYDLLIYGTKAPTFLLKSEDIGFTQRSKVIFDLSVPRNVDPEIGSHPKIALFNVDQITGASGVRKKVPHLALRSPLIAQAVDRQISLFRKRESYLLSKVS